MLGEITCILCGIGGISRMECMECLRRACHRCHLREVPDAAASQVDKMSWVAGLAEARCGRERDHGTLRPCDRGSVERAGGTTSGVQAQEH